MFVPAWSQYNQPNKIVTLGPYYPQARAGEAKALLREARASYTVGNLETGLVRSGVGWTQVINALNKDRRWSLQLLFERLNPMLEQGIAIAVVPAHTAYTVSAPIRELARQLASEAGRVDAGGCLERHTPIARILFGGPSTRALHRQTVTVTTPELVQGRRILLLDDIAKSGASLIACRELLHEAGAPLVQAVCLGRVIIGAEPPALAP